MDLSKFTDKKTGTLIQVSRPEKDHAFIPAPLPPVWGFDPDLWPILADAREALGRLDGMARTLPNPKLLLTPLRNREALTSSRLEGTFATAQELILFELDPQQPKSSNQANSWREVANYNLALSKGFTGLDSLPLCLRFIKELHSTLLEGVRGAQARPGEFRTHQVHLGSTRRYIPPPPLEIDKCLNDLEAYMNADDNRFDNLVRCFLVHYQLEAIHPFGDGNGRIGRVLLSLMIQKWCGLQMPWLYLSPYFEKYKDEYIDNMFLVSADGAWSKWIEYCLRGVIIQAKEAVRLCNELKCLKETMHNKITSGSARVLRIIDDLFSSPYARIVPVMKKMDVTYHTAQKDLDLLVKNEILIVLRDLKPKTYLAPEIFRIAYGNDFD